MVSLDKKEKDGKSHLEELLEKSRSMNENSNKAITDGMNMIFSKMSELERKHEENLRREVEEIKRKMMEENKQKTITVDSSQKER